MVWTAQIVWILLLWTSLLPSSKGLKRGRKSTTNLQTIAEQKLTASLASHYSDVMYFFTIMNITTLPGSAPGCRTGNRGKISNS